MSDPERPIIGVQLDRAHVSIPVDLQLYSVDAAMRAAYKLTDRCFVWFQRDSISNDQLNVFVIGRSPTADLTPLVLEFQNELLDQQLRVRLEQQFHDVRTLIVAQAFSEGNLIDPAVDDADHLNDPYGAGKHR